MNPGICYLYEYENNQRKRNVGFLKIARHYQSCILQIHARGIRAGNGAALELYAFYLDNGRMIASQIASLTCFSHMISIRLPVTESHFPEGRSLQQIDGFLLRFPADGMPVFWMASTAFFDVNLANMQSPEEAAAPDTSDPSASDGKEIEPDFSSDAEPDIFPEESILPDKESSEDHASRPVVPDDADNTAFPDNETAPENTLPSDNGPGSSSEERIPPDDPAAADSQTQPGIMPPPQEDNSPMEEPPEDPVSTQEETSVMQQESTSRGSRSASAPTARKITRREISLLPRKYWFLANNSFLLHGYHNYSHLLLVKEEGHLWLGVPGIYDPREARAADLFGFPQFTREYVPLLNLSEDERNDSADFGHWCRYISQCESSSDDSRSRDTK